MKEQLYFFLFETSRPVNHDIGEPSSYQRNLSTAVEVIGPVDSVLHFVVEASLEFSCRAATRDEEG